jgi:hypothetical protein
MIVLDTNLIADAMKPAGGPRSARRAQCLTVRVICGPLRYLRYDLLLVGSKQIFDANNAKGRK